MSRILNGQFLAHCGFTFTLIHLRFHILGTLYRRHIIMRRAQLPGAQVSLVRLQPLLPPPLPAQPVQAPYRCP
jgi:hypothetical protein